MNTFIFDGSWNQIKGVLRQKFAQLTDADLEFIQGKGEELLGRLQTKLGMSRVDLELMLDNIKASISGGVQAAQEKFGQAKSKVSEFAGQWKDKAGAMADDIAARASATAAGVEARAGAAYAEGRRQALNLHECVEEQVRRTPREAVLTALAAGFVIGLLIHRRV